MSEHDTLAGSVSVGDLSRHTIASVLFERWFIPRSIRSGEVSEYQRALLALKFALGIGVCTAGFGLVLIGLDAVVMGGFDVGLSALICLSPIVIRVTRSVDVGCHAVITSIVIMLTGVSLLGGGMLAPTVPVLVMAPMVAVFLLNRRAGYIWTGIVTGLILVVATIEAVGHPFRMYMDSDDMPFIRTSVYVSLFAVAVLFVLLYDSAKQKAVAEVKAANQRMNKMIVHVEATSEALSHSAAVFFGRELGASEVRDTAGLTQQMMSTAATGRTIIDNVGERIRGMIAQYNQISERIDELHEQSGTIAEMVQTIDKISDRLDLMALNTGIEAANAGEAGKRFALLADDMRRLAVRVTTETRQITQAIRRVYGHTDDAKAASRTGRMLTDEGVAELDRMARAFDELYQLIERTTEASKRVTHDTESQIAAIHRLANVSSHQPRD